MVIEQIIKLAIAFILGGIIGSEREKEDKPAGLRTCMLVCLGACAFSMIQIDQVQRVFAHCVSGIGFLGSGIIIIRKGNCDGVTTAATLWSLVGIGLLLGNSQYALSITLTILTYLVLILKYIEVKMKEKR